MDPDIALKVGRDALVMILMLSFPLLCVGLIVGVIISVIQAITQIQELTLTFVPKILAMTIAAVLLMPFTLQKMLEYASLMFGTMPIP